MPRRVLVIDREGRFRKAILAVLEAIADEEVNAAVRAGRLFELHCGELVIAIVEAEFEPDEAYMEP